jgi:signal transduction histidine kinase
MHAVTIVWASVAGIALTLSGVHVLLWLLDRRSVANLVFGIVAFSVAGLSITELGMMHSASGAEYGWWVRWFHLPNFFAVAGLVIFVQLQFGTGRAWLAGAVIALRALLLGVNFLVEPNVNWIEISSLRTIPFLGEQVSVIGAAVLRPIQPVATLASVLFIVYVADALVRAWRRGDPETRRRALIVCGAILAFISLAILETQLIIWKVVQMPVVVAPLFLTLMAAITYELCRGIVLSRRVERQAQGLRDELAHVARVNTVTQLSASLAHELSQPLTAILLNAQAAEMMLASGTVDVPELRAILADVRSEDRRAADIIQRARALMKGSTLELHEVSVADIARDVFALVRTDAIVKRVTLESSVPDLLPQVRADRVQLAQVLLNLVLNAMDSVALAVTGERRVRVEARHARDEIVEIAVVDSGAGIAPELLPRVFDAFMTTKPAGLGIGLAVSRAIVEAHGGVLWAENNGAGGATFRFTLRSLS